VTGAGAPCWSDLVRAPEASKPVDATATAPGIACEVCGSARVVWRACKLVCENCRTILKTCADC
jgi:hypothetical protein